VYASNMGEGSYVLIIEMEKDKKIEIGKLGVLSFEKGYYAYVGSAMNGLDVRINRHMRQDKKKHWHIDYLLEEAVVRQVLCIEGEKKECTIASEMEGIFDGITNFGSSDCRCNTHLFHSKNLGKMMAAVKGMGLVNWRN